MKTPYVFLLASLLLVCCLPAAAQQKPMIVVLDFESKFDDGELGRKVAKIFRGHAFRRRIYQTMDDLTLNEILADAAVSRGPAITRDQLVSLARNDLRADLILWGTVTYIGGDDYRIQVQGLDVRTDPPTAIIDATYDCDGVHEMPQNVDKALNSIEKKPPKPEVDLAADESWKKRKNLVKNPGFEKGKKTPINWEPVNGLTSYWVDNESPTGKCVMFDTDVYLSEWEEWRDKFNAGAPASEAPKKSPTKPPAYNTVGGTVGAHIYSDPIPIKPGMTYRLDFDLKAPAGATSRVFVKGYATIDDTLYPGKDADLVTKMLEKEGVKRLPKEGRYGEQDREVYRAPVTLRVAGNEANKWKHFCRLFRPTQSLIILNFTSKFDGGASGRMLAEAIYNPAKQRGTFGVFDKDKVKQALASRKLPITSDSTSEEIALFAGEEFGHAIVLYGRIIEAEPGQLVVYLMSLDVRQKIWDPLFKCTYHTSPDKLNEVASRIMIDLQRGKPVVKFLRIKLDCYWPRGYYYFDNVTLTEEGLGK